MKQYLYRTICSVLFPKLRTAVDLGLNSPSVLPHIHCFSATHQSNILKATLFRGSSKSRVIPLLFFLFSSSPWQPLALWLVIRLTFNCHFLLLTLNVSPLATGNPFSCCTSLSLCCFNWLLLVLTLQLSAIPPTPPSVTIFYWLC